MKIYISADIEGVTGAAAWDETMLNKPDYRYFQEQMTREVNAACQGAVRAGATEIYVKDAHGTGRNLLLRELPEQVCVLRGWSNHPLGMMDGIDESCDAALMIGYHSGSGSDASPLAHTLSGALVSMELNGEPVTEFHISAFTAALFGVPVVFVSGDEGLCNIVKDFNRHVTAVWGSIGRGEMVTCLHPDVVLRNIEESVYNALTEYDSRGEDSASFEKCLIPVPSNCSLEMTFKLPAKAYKASHYPGMKLISPLKVLYQTEDFHELLRMLMFVVW